MTEDSGKSPPASPPESDSATPTSTEEEREEEFPQDQSPPTSTEEEREEELPQDQSPPTSTEEESGEEPTQDLTPPTSTEEEREEELPQDQSPPTSTEEESGEEPTQDQSPPTSTEEEHEEELPQDQSPPTSTEEKREEELAQDQTPPESPPAPPPDLEAPGEEPPDEGGFGALGGAMTFLEHLDELRKRLLHSAAAVGIAFAICWAFSEEIFRFLAVPIADVVAPGQDIETGMKELIFLRPTEPFSIWIKVSFVAALFLSAPYLLLQVWLFIAPGLYRKEKSYAIPFLVSSTLLFMVGGAFAYYVILPTALEFLINEFGRPFRAMVSAIEYFNFEVIVLVGMGMIFQLPVLVAFLSLFGLISPGFLWRNFRYALLVILIVAAVISPTADVLNLFLWSGPMLVLYVISIGISWIFKKRRERSEE